LSACQEFVESLTAYADGRASEAEAREVSRHLEGCGACARELRWMKAGKAALGALPRPALPPELRAALLKEAAKRRGSPLRGFWAWLASPRVGAPVGLAFAAAAALLMLRHYRGAEEIPLEDMLAAHEEYALTMPAAAQDVLYLQLGVRVEGGSDDL